MKKYRYLLAALVILAAMLLSGSAVVESPYADAGNWAWLPGESEKEADLFFVAPTVYEGDESHFNMELSDETGKASLLAAADLERGIFEQSCNLYAPYYRQASLSAYELEETEREQCLALAYEDISAAFEYYMDNYNDGRPVVLAGSAQGGDMVLRLLKDSFDNEAYQSTLIAAYVIGTEVTEADIAAYPYLKLAECRWDGGCIVSFGSETDSETLTNDVSGRVEQYLTLKFLTDNYSLAEQPDAETPLDTPAPYLSLASNVTPEMLNAQYWIDKIEKPDAVFMTAEEIDAFNSQAHEEYYTYIGNSAPRSLSYDELSGMLQSMGASDYDCYHDGERLTEEYWSAVLEQRNLSAVKDTNPLRYGICVKRASLRILPTDDTVSTQAQFTFYDELQNSTTLYNEPVIVIHNSTDGEWLYVLTRYCSGWVHKDAVALCSSLQQWESAQSFKDFLVVTDDKLRTELDPVDEHCSEIELSMGVRLELTSAANFRKSAEGRYGADCYVVKLPYRDDDGNYAFTYAFLPVSLDVHVGYLELTPANILKLAFASDGCRYGWGGMYNARDCSQLIMELYRCFGLFISRNSEDQTLMPCRTVKLDGMSGELKSSVIEKLPAGSIMHFPGHVMLYLGEVGGRQYVISSVGSMCPSGSADKEVLTYESVMVNDLSVVRRNTHTWLSDMDCAKIFWETAAEG